MTLTYARRCLVAFGMVAFSFGAQVGPADASGVDDLGALAVVITGTQAGVGDVRVNLYASAESFLYNEDAQAETQVLADGEPTVTFADLLPGSYALVAYYDINKNGKLDRGLFGIPLEPLGFSNGVVPVFSAPDFEEAAFRVGEGLREIAITLRSFTKARRTDS